MLFIHTPPPSVAGSLRVIPKVVRVRAEHWQAASEHMRNTLPNLQTTETPQTSNLAPPLENKREAKIFMEPQKSWNSQSNPQKEQRWSHHNS